MFYKSIALSLSLFDLYVIIQVGLLHCCNGAPESTISSTLRSLAFALSALAALGSLYLAGVLYLVLHDMCLVCHAAYAVNAALLFFTWRAATN